MTLQHLWAAWRLEYIESATAAERGEGEGGCVFCRLAASGPPSAENGVVWRDELVFVVLNLYPYASGHLLIVPVRHVGGLGELTAEESAGLWAATRRAIEAVGGAYDPDGINMGANLGRAAGAGIPNHVHLHVVPRWSGDTNFMTAVAGVRVLPQSLEDSWTALRASWPD
ncbi:MAG TPA: HIT domain-containing protein [Acidimicrobiales bacterium]|nr:HIT domain-containing protein [Acidimicrobiales bacterium]